MVMKKTTAISLVCHAIMFLMWGYGIYESARGPQNGVVMQKIDYIYFIVVVAMFAYHCLILTFLIDKSLTGRWGLAVVCLVMETIVFPAYLYAGSLGSATPLGVLFFIPAALTLVSLISNVVCLAFKWSY